jgi:signal transduction histidine kinase
LPRLASDGPVLAAGDELEWLLCAVGPRLALAKRFWICLHADGQCIGGIVWGAAVGESNRLSGQAQEIAALACGWQLALRMAQIREESRLMAEQLAQSNRQLQSAQGDLQRGRLMISIGEMAAGAAHEMNNPLTVIAGRSQLLASQLADVDQKALANLIHEQSNRLSQIISDLMAYAKPSPPQPKTCDVADLVEHALQDAKMRGDSTDRTVETTLPEVPAVVVDESQVAAALAEVIDNALLATDSRMGRVEIQSAYDAGSRRVVLTVLDDGCGMNESALRQAFDPFFSSKPAGRRRGMGLSKAQRWIEASGGAIKLESRPGKGTRVVILLPAVELPAQGKAGDKVGAKIPGRKAAM